MLTETFTLANGVEIPKIGFGTWLIDDAETPAAMAEALKIGYRHLDTAQAYENERGVGEGLRNSGLDRSDVFVTTKVAAEHKTYEAAAASIDTSLAAMGLDYADLIIIHHPQPWADVNQSDDRYIQGNRDAWRALEDAYEAGKVRAIGVSNFQIEDLENLFESCRIRPMVNQILAHVGNMPFELIDYCQSHDMLVEAYSPVAHGVIFDNPQVKQIADQAGVTIAQLCVRYLLQLGLLPLPKAKSPAHMRENTEVDFQISAADMEALNAITGIDDYKEHSFFPVYGGKL